MKKMRVYIVAAAVAVAVAVYLLTGFIADTRSYGAAATHADAIVVLTGGKGRVEEGLRLLRREAAEVLILSGVHRDSEVDSIFHGETISDGERGRIILEKNSRSTYENAREVRGLVRDRGISSIILITSAYHMKRAEKTFLRVLPGDVTVEPYAVVSPNFDSSRWWGGTSLGIALVELVKYWGYEVRFAFGAAG